MAGTDADGNCSMPEPLLIEQLVFEEVIHSDKGTITLLQKRYHIASGLLLETGF